MTSQEGLSSMKLVGFADQLKFYKLTREYTFMCVSFFNPHMLRAFALGGFGHFLYRRRAILQSKFCFPETLVQAAIGMYGNCMDRQFVLQKRRYDV
jgi:hypothetical protein